MRTSKIGLLISVMAFPMAVHAVEDWQGLQTGIPEAVSVEAVAVYDAENVYAAADMGNYRRTVYKWDGKNWSTLGTLNYLVNSMVVDKNNRLFVGGGFYAANWQGPGWLNNNVGYIAEFDPATSKFKLVGAGVNNYVKTLSLDNTGNLFVGGSFNQTNAYTQNSTNYPAITDLGGVAKWDGVKWSQAGLYYSGGWRNTLAIGSNGSETVGAFNDLNGKVMISRWTNNSYWGEIAPRNANNTAVNGSISSIAVNSKGDIYVAGNFNEIANITGINRIVKFEKATGMWKPLQSGLNGEVRSLSIDSNDNLYAAGNFTGTADGSKTFQFVAKFDDLTQSWQSVGSGMTSMVNGIIAHKNSVYAVGTFSKAAGNLVNYVAKLGTDVENAAETAPNNQIALDAYERGLLEGMKSCGLSGQNPVYLFDELTQQGSLILPMVDMQILNSDTKNGFEKLVMKNAYTARMRLIPDSNPASFEIVQVITNSGASNNH